MSSDRNESCNYGACYSVSAECVLKRLCRARDTARDPQLIIVDVRESCQYRAARILTAQSANCSTKTMAKRAVVSWDCQYSAHRGCPAPVHISPNDLCTQITQVTGPDIIVYDQRSKLPPDDSESPVGHFINALLSRGNALFFLVGGFDAFQLLRSTDFIDRGLPIQRIQPTIDHSDTMSSGCFQGLTYEEVEAPIYPEDVPLVHQSRAKVVSLGAAPGETKASTSLLDVRKCAFKGYVPTRNSEAHAMSNSARSINDNQEDVGSAHISQILPFLYLGNARDAQNSELLRQLHVTHIINVTDSVPMPFAHSLRLRYLHLPVLDTSQQDLLPAFDRAIVFINDARNNNGVVLVHCQAGVSRSASVVLAYMMYTNRNLTVLQALDFVHRRRPIAGPNLHFMGQLQHYYDELHNNTHTTVPRSTADLNSKNVVRKTSVNGI